MSRYSERRVSFILFLVLSLLASASPIISVTALRTSNFYYVDIAKVDYPVEVPINFTFRITVVVNYSLPILSGYSSSTSKWLMAARLYNSTVNGEGPSAQAFLATSNVDEVSNGGTQVFSIAATAPSFPTTITFTIYAMYQSGSSFMGSNLLSGVKPSQWSYTHGPNSHVEISIKVSQDVGLHFATNNLQIPINIDGYQQYETDNSGRLTVKLAVFRWHLLEIPATVDLGVGMRAVFISWQDGTNSTVRNVFLQSATFLNATYKRQLLLKVNGNPGSGWYDEGGYVIVTAPLKKKIGGVLGIMGFEEVFAGWKGDVESANTTAYFLMNKPHSITAEWRTRFKYGWKVIAGGVIGFFSVIALSLIVLRQRRLNPQARPNLQSPNPTTQFYARARRVRVRLVFFCSLTS